MLLIFGKESHLLHRVNQFIFKVWFRFLQLEQACFVGNQLHPVQLVNPIALLQKLELGIQLPQLQICFRKQCPQLDFQVRSPKLRFPLHLQEHLVLQILGLI